MKKLELSNSGYSNFNLDSFKPKNVIATINKDVKDAGKNIVDTTKVINKNILDTTKSAVKNVMSTTKKANKKLKDLAGKAASAYKKLLRKAILSNTYLLIRANAHGIATGLYPAIVSDAESLSKKYKASYIQKSKATYAEVLKKWNDMGGNTSKLNDAIIKGQKLRLPIFKKSPYISPVSGFDGYTNMYALPYPNNSGYSNLVDDSAGDTAFDSETGMPVETSDSASASNEKVDTTDYTALSDQGVDGVNAEEKQTGYKAFISWIRGVFKKHKADEIPYEEVSTEAANFLKDKTADSTQVPVDTVGNNIINTVDDTQIWGINKNYFYAGTTIFGLSVIYGSYKLYQKLKKNK